MSKEVEKPEARRAPSLSLAALTFSLAALLLACAALTASSLAASRPVQVSVEVVYPTPATTPTAHPISAPATTPTAHPVSAPPSTPSHSESRTGGYSPPPLEMTECLVLSNTVYAAFTVRTSEPTAFFFEVPVLTDGETTVPADPDSLEQARFDALRRLTTGEAEFSLTFPVEGPDPERDWTVVFNPSHEEEDWVAPKFSFPCRR
ncbi:MAG TPA: hypothetical protein EYP77_04060 [Anaerolineae bacterium]|nr:hypothetical protein [Anaerolineae bacterium]